MSYQQYVARMKYWYEAHACTHAHCPNLCEHPQPFLASDGRLLCGRCAICEDTAVEVVPCDERTCDV